MALQKIVVRLAKLISENPAPVLNPWTFEVTFECLEKIEGDISWQLIYVSSPDDHGKDQELDSVELTPDRTGLMKFRFEADPPDFSKIGPDDVLGATALLLEGFYKQQEFVRVGWYVHNVYNDPQLNEDPPDIPIIDNVIRYVLVDEPRMTTFSINWDNIFNDQPMEPLNSENIINQQQQQQQQQQPQPQLPTSFSSSYDIVDSSTNENLLIDPTKINQEIVSSRTTITQPQQQPHPHDHQTHDNMNDDDDHHHDHKINLYRIENNDIVKNDIFHDSSKFQSYHNHHDHHNNHDQQTDQQDNSGDITMTS